MSKHWEIAFCGLGSIGSRHLRNLKTVMEERGDKYSVDWIQSRKRELPEEFKGIIHKTFFYLDKIDKDYDVIFITNPTSEHFAAIDYYQWHTKSLFIEKPLFDRDEIRLSNINNACTFYVACPVRYKKVIQYLKTEVDLDEVLSAIAVCSSYLPEWRKGTDYRKGYSAKKDMGGGVSLDLIHEIDYLTYLLGDVKQIFNIRDQVSPLELDSDDVSVYIAKLKKSVVEIYLDYFGRKDIRTLTFFCKEDTLNVDLLSNRIEYLKSGKVISFDEERDDFQKRELHYYFDILDGKNANSNDLSRAYQTLKNSFGRL